MRWLILAGVVLAGCGPSAQDVANEIRGDLDKLTERQEALEGQIAALRADLEKRDREIGQGLRNAVDHFFAAFESFGQTTKKLHEVYMAVSELERRLIDEMAKVTAARPAPNPDEDALIEFGTMRPTEMEEQRRLWKKLQSGEVLAEHELKRAMASPSPQIRQAARRYAVERAKRFGMDKLAP